MKDAKLKQTICKPCIEESSKRVCPCKALEVLVKINKTHEQLVSNTLETL
jgi:hypothetical protein